MPILPLDHPEPFAACLGVMLYPGTDEADRAKARAFTAQWLAEPLRRFHLGGHALSYDALAHIAEGAGQPLQDLDERWYGGSQTGQVFKAFFALACSNEPLASWNNAIRIAEVVATRESASGARSAIWQERMRFLSVAHLWAAWAIREGKFEQHPEVGYDSYADFQSFLTEAEILRRWGQSWRPRRAKSEPPLPPDLWRVPDDWSPPVRQLGWPETGKVATLQLPDDLLASLKPAGRPRAPS